MKGARYTAPFSFVRLLFSCSLYFVIIYVSFDTIKSIEMRKIYFSLLFIGVLIALTSTALAVPPPDFLFSLGASVVQIFGIILVFLTAALYSVKHYAKALFTHMKHKKMFWGVAAGFVLLVSFGGAYFFNQFQQEVEYELWMKESSEYASGTETVDISLDLLMVNGDDVVVAAENPEFEDKKIGFIRAYYQNIAEGDLDQAYEVSKKSVPFSTFVDWYKEVQSISIDSIQEIESMKYSLRLTLNEKSEIASYGVLLTLAETDSGYRIVDSTSRVLSTKVISNGIEVKPVETAKIDQPIKITNPEFTKIIAANPQVYVLDAREDEEFEIGRFPGSIHIRFADLLAGEWIAVPTDKPVYVFCWSGIRGKEVADFLRTKKIAASYIESGANGWVQEGGRWDGGIKFLEKFPQERFQKLFDFNGLKSEIENGTVIVDSRNKTKFNAWHIPDSVNIPVIYTPTSQMQSVLSQVPVGSKVITVCDDFISCFDAKLTGLKLERAGNTFLGRYNKPWEYRNNI